MKKIAKSLKYYVDGLLNHGLMSSKRLITTKAPPAGGASFHIESLEYQSFTSS